jgi:alpha-tubulin suppressor-like RCC1 family protein
MVTSHSAVTADFNRKSLGGGIGGHMCAIVPSDGAVRCWGFNAYGQLGVGDQDIYGDTEPASSSGEAISSSVVQVVAGSNHSCALLSNGDVRCWGRSNVGQLGYGVTNDDIGDDLNESVGGTVSIGAPVIQLAAGQHHTCALLDSGSVRCWGEGANGRLGYGDLMDRGGTMASLPSLIGNVPLGGLATQIVASGAHTCALLENGTVYCWGLGSTGRLGYPGLAQVGDTSMTTPMMVGPVNIGGTAIQISAGGSHTCALLATNEVRCWGDAGYGQLGTEDTDDIGDDEAPVDGPLADVGGTVVQISAGSWHTCALIDTGDVKCWGRADEGQLGYGNEDVIGTQVGDMPPPVVNVGGSVIEIDARMVTCARLASEAIRCWGDDQVGTLGYGSPEEDIGDNEHPASAGDVPYIP